MSYCSEYTSRKIRVLSFLAMVMVVSIHSGPFSLMTDLSSATLLVAGWIDDVQCWIQFFAIPLIVVLIGFTVACLVRRVCPRMFAVLNGGR